MTSSSGRPVRPTLDLRPYQTDFIGAVRARWEAGDARVIGQLPTGCGKTLTASQIIAEHVASGDRVLFLAHRRELLQQARRTLRNCYAEQAVSTGIVQGENNDVDARVVYGSVDTLRNGQRLDAVLEHGAPGLVVVDEAHHSAAPSWIKTLEALAEANAGTRFLGLTATPVREDARDLGEFWARELAFAYPVSTAIREGYLAPPRFEFVSLPDFDESAVAKRAGDYVAADLARDLMEAEVIEHTTAAILKHATGRRTIVFTTIVEQARLQAEDLTRAGLAAAYVDGGMGEDERASILRRFALGEIDVLCNCAILTEGFDDPAVSCVVLARPTRSHPLFLQMVGRGLRLFPGKQDCLVLDISGACKRFALDLAPVLAARPEDSDPRERGEGTATGTSEYNPYAGLFRGMAKSHFVWFTLDERLPKGTAYAAACDGGEVVLLRRPDGLWAAWHLREAGAPISLVHEPTSIDMARALAEGYVGRVASKALSRRDREWRNQPPSEKQIATLQRWKIPVTPDSKGAAGVLMSKFLVPFRLQKAGLIADGRLPYPGRFA